MRLRTTMSIAHYVYISHIHDKFTFEDTVAHQETTNPTSHPMIICIVHTYQSTFSRVRGAKLYVAALEGTNEPET